MPASHPFVHIAAQSKVCLFSLKATA